MTLLHRLASILGWLFRRDRAERMLDDELQAYVEMSTAAKVRDGVPPEQARLLAREDDAAGAPLMAVLSSGYWDRQLASAFGLLALTLACVGVYGLLAYSVAQRTREIGIRMAVGAPRTQVVALVLGRGARLMLIGMAVALPARHYSSIASARILTSTR